MDRILKYEIKSDIRNIIAEIDYEEYMFNKIFKSDVTFKNSYEKFNLIYNVYGPQAYRKFVPSKYQKQDAVNLINTQSYLLLYDRHGKKMYKNLEYTITLENYEKYHGRAKTLMYKMLHIFSRKKLSFFNDTALMLPETIPYIDL